MWREGLAGTALSVDYQRILAAIDDRIRLGQGPLTCQEMATAFGLDVVPARVEGLRSKAKRLVSRGWLAEGVDHQFRIPPGTGSGRTTGGTPHPSCPRDTAEHARGGRPHSRTGDRHNHTTEQPS